MLQARSREVLRLPLPGRSQPEAIARVLAGRHEDVVWSDRRHALVERVSFIGVGEEVLLRRGAAGADPVGEVLEAVRDGLPRAGSARLGWWGWLGYELGAEALGVPSPCAGTPAAALLLAAVGVELDHDAGTAAVVALPGREQQALALRALLAAAPAGRTAPVPAPARARWRHGRTAYLAMVEECRRAIAAGDAYQLCLTNRATVRLPARQDPVDVLARLSAAARVPSALLLRIAGRALVSASPETFLAVDARGRAASRPIKGTRRRDPDPVTDAALAEELRTSEKERAENVMIVDLVRNDLGAVARVGSVQVPGLLEVERHRTVHQLVSTVTADVARDPLAAVRALFPAGSMTGAPKRAAVAILRDLEAGPRGVYGGAAGRFSADGSIDLAVVIRSIVLDGRTATVGAGGGITILSDAAAEWAEVELKARPLLAALGAPLPGSSA